MMKLPRKAVLSCGVAVGALAIATGAWAQQRAFDIPAQPATKAVPEFARQAGIQIISSGSDLRGLQARPVKGEHDVRTALALMLAGTGLAVDSDDGSTIVLRKVAADPQGGSAARGGAEVDALIVTAQKREEDIQDVPIAISAFSQEDLTTRQVAGGPDLMTQVPNMTFTKTNFSSYSIQIRGIGTQAISATTDAAVAVAFNNTPFIRNRFFEQEFYDLQRIEVLRGPQGTLYGRNATAGVVNIISNKPTFGFESMLSGDVANYKSTRLEGMINMPLVEDKVALRLAGAWTKRNGYVTNEITGNPIDGRDLWSTRLSLRFAPTDRLDVNLIWEHFEEDDDRLRSGKQVCKTHEVTEVAGFPTTHYQILPEKGQPLLFAGVQGTFSQGCLPASLYAAESYSTPNGISLPYYLPLSAVFLPTALDDPYVSRFQSRDLRVIESTVDPHYAAKTELGELQINFDLTDALTFTSETAVLADKMFSTQDYNRFNTASGAWEMRPGLREGLFEEGPNGPIFCDPQIGCADRMVAVDLIHAKSHHFSQEFRVGSDFDGAFNFSLGANFLRYDTEDKYYVFINSLSIIAAISPFGFGGGDAPPYVGGVTDNLDCLPKGLDQPDPTRIADVLGCTYMDPNPIGSLNDQGHNYFLSRNPYKLISYAVFGEAYYNITDNLKVTAGLRWTVDKKEAPRIPSWVLAENTAGYPVTDVTRQDWTEPTGRLTIDWKPDLPFTDETLIYGSYAHGYKAGGANPPPMGPVMYCSACAAGDFSEAVVAKSATHPKTFEPEFVDAFEVGAKNILLDGRLTVNTAAFYYDYTGYQISQIINRSALNFNFDAKIWGLEIEADWRPLENLRLGFKGGYENTRVADGMQAVDVMDRTAGNPDWVVVRPFPTFPSNCILPAELFVGVGGLNGGGGPEPHLINLGGKGGGNPGACELAYVLNQDPVTNLPYVPNPQVGGTLSTLANHPDYAGFNPATAPNNGEGFYKDISGNELPNAPDYTATITADYTVPLWDNWLATLHADFYYQSEAWWRIFNIEGYDKLKAYTNVNLAAIFTNEDAGWRGMVYIKNLMDRDAITGAFLNSDDTGLTTNVFLTEPRLYGIRITKEWGGGPWWTGANPDHKPGEPYPLTVELSGQVQRHKAPYETLMPEFGDSFPASLNPLLAQHRDLDWGDGREVKLTIRPRFGWTVAAAMRYGRTNTGTARIRQEESAGPAACVFDRYGGPPFDRFGRRLCDPTYVIPGYEQYGPGYGYNPLALVSPENWSDATARSREEHEVIDFKVGKDVGLGVIGMGSSSLALGARFARVNSTTHTRMDGIPDWDVPDGTYFNNATHHRYTAFVDVRREFDGTGPTLSWDASSRLFGNEEIGHVDLDWSVTGGVLFGKQNTAVIGYEASGYFSSLYMVPPSGLPPLDTTTIDIHRSQSATVPVVDLSLGLSYEIQRVKIGAGYRWERYFDVLDTGFEEENAEDRTIDGPYFKIAIGFGG